MKTPQEKAKELVDKYYYLFSVKLENTIADYEAIECALIAVDEILLSHSFALCGIKPSIYKYWQEVKEEINKL